MISQRSKWALVGVVALLIGYGSLYPFEFSSPGRLVPTVLDFASRWGSDGRVTDLLANIALFAPLGFAAALAVRSGVAAVVGCVGFALALQVVQLWLPDRVAALSDVAWNGIGALAGAWAARLTETQTLRARIPGLQPVPIALCATWLLVETLPLVPGLGWQQFKDSVKPLWYGAGWDFGTFLVECSMALAVLELLFAAGLKRSLMLTSIVLGSVLALKVIVVARGLDVATVSAFAVAWLASWPLARQSRHRRQAILIGALLVGFTLEAVLPLQPAAVPGEFHWMPFASMLSGSLLAGAINGVRLLFTFGATLWLLRQAGGRRMPAAIGLALWVFLLEIAQVLLAGHTADITPVLLVLAAAWGLSLLERTPTPQARKERRSPAFTEAVAETSANPSRTWRWAAPTAVLVMAVSFHALVQLPGVPYNVGELFLGDSLFPYKITFALALLWIGIGPALIAQRLLKARFPWAELPVLVVAASLTSLLLFALSVTGESLMDIAGSNNINWFVIHRQIWGEWAAELFRRLDAPALVAFFERPVRYTALVGPVFLALTLVGAGFGVRQRRLRRQQWLLLLAVALPVFWLCKAIAFDWSSTDNLNELIARRGAWGAGGGFYLYLLLFVFSAHAVGAATVRSLRGVGAAAAVSALALPISWWLLNHGLEPNIEKYGSVFSGAQFLLGPDRTQLLPQSELLLRWAVVYLGGVVVVAGGFRIGLASVRDLAAQRAPRTASLPAASRPQPAGGGASPGGET